MKDKRAPKTREILLTEEQREALSGLYGDMERFGGDVYEALGDFLKLPSPRATDLTDRRAMTVRAARGADVH